MCAGGWSLLHPCRNVFCSAFLFAIRSIFCNLASFAFICWHESRFSFPQQLCDRVKPSLWRQPALLCPGLLSCRAGPGPGGVGAGPGCPEAPSASRTVVFPTSPFCPCLRSVLGALEPSRTNHCPLPTARLAVWAGQGRRELP